MKKPCALIDIENHVITIGSGVTFTEVAREGLTSAGWSIVEDDTTVDQINSGVTTEQTIPILKGFKDRHYKEVEKQEKKGFQEYCKGGRGKKGGRRKFMKKHGEY